VCKCGFNQVAGVVPEVTVTPVNAFEKWDTHSS